MNEEIISRVVSQVLHQLRSGETQIEATGGALGVYDCIRDAIGAADDAFRQLQKKGVSGRKAAIDEIRRLAVEKAAEWGRIEFEETKIGRLDHKIEKLEICGRLIPGVEMLQRQVFSGDLGLTVIDFAPFGVIGAVTPSTHSIPTLMGNAINMIAAGNSVVFNTHPAACYCAAVAVQEMNQAIYRQTGISNLLTTVRQPTLDSYNALIDDSRVRLLCVTGGPALAAAAMKANKRAVVAGPGNPPVVVDETACLQRAARSIISGAAYDNNLLCIGEKEVFVVAKVADQLMDALSAAGAYRLDSSQIDALTGIAFKETGKPEHPYQLNREVIGKDATVLAELIGLGVPAKTELLFGETDGQHPFVQEEQMTTFIPIVRVPDVDAAIEAAIEAEHGYKHTAVMHSRDIDNLSKFMQRADTTLFIKNGPCMTGLGLGGEGFLSYSIATPTGEGPTTPMTFAKSRRCTMVEQLNLY